MMTLREVLNAITLEDDGYAMDVFYQRARNRERPSITEEFLRGWLADGAVKLEGYLNGWWVPTVGEAVDNFAQFVKKADQDAGLLAEYFKLDGQGRVVDVNKVDPEKRIFLFENVATDIHRTKALFERYGVRERFSPVHFLKNPEQQHSRVSTYTTGDDAVIVGDSYVTNLPKQHELRSAALHSIVSRDGKVFTRCFHGFYDRIMPLLKFYYGVVQHYKNTSAARAVAIEASQQRLERILQSEFSDSEKIFRQNAEKYWKSVLDGRSLEGAAASSSPRNRGRAAMDGPTKPSQGMDLRSIVGSEAA
jgi:hypothetical protein